jgi:excisionase family DNA binding protein
MEKDDPLMTVPEVAATLRLHPDTVRRWLRAGQLPAVNLGGRRGYRVRRSELDRFLAALSTPGSSGSDRTTS